MVAAAALSRLCVGSDCLLVALLSLLGKLEGLQLHARTHKETREGSLSRACTHLHTRCTSDTQH